MEWKGIAAKRRLLSASALIKLNNDVSALESKFSNEHFVILLTGSYGDVYPTFALLNSLIRYHSTPVDVILNEKYRSLSRRFSGEGISFYFTKQDQQIRQAVCLVRPQPHLEKGKIFPALPTLFPFLAEASLTQRITTFMELYRLLFDLPKNAPLKWHGDNHDLLRDEASFFFSKQKLPEKKTLLVSLITNSQVPLNYSLQEDLLQKLSRFYFIAINTTTDNRDKIPSFYTKYFNIEVPAHLPTEVAALCGQTLVGYSGLAYILAVQPHEAKVVCIEKKFNVNLNIPNTLLETLPISLSAGPDFSNPCNFREILFSDDQSSGLADMVLSELL